MCVEFVFFLTAMCIVNKHYAWFVLVIVQFEVKFEGSSVAVCEGLVWLQCGVRMVIIVDCGICVERSNGCAVFEYGRVV